MSKKIILTGGGTAGHVTPTIALLPALKEAGYEIYYIGSKTGMEKELIEKEGIPYYGISSGKLRRYFNLKNFTDPFRVIHGFFQALGILGRIKPDVVFSKGGFVSVPVVLAARLRRIPAVLHESDMTPGLANRIAMRGAKKICCNFPETLSKLPADKGVVTGTPIRQSLYNGSREKGLSLCGFSPEDQNKQTLLVMGGSQGSVFINTAVREALPELQKSFRIIHLCGKGKKDEALSDRSKYPDYVQYEYIDKELPDIMAAADIVISRSGANAICELLALSKPAILIPLALNASRGDQILNARSFEKQGFSYLLEEENVNKDSLLEAVSYVSEHKDDYLSAMNHASGRDAISTIMGILESF